MSLSHYFHTQPRLYLGKIKDGIVLSLQHVDEVIPPSVLKKKN